MKAKGLTIIKLLFSIVFLGLVVYGQRTVGREYLLIQFIGLAGIIFLLWDYNRKFI